MPLIRLRLRQLRPAGRPSLDREQRFDWLNRFGNELIGPGESPDSGAAGGVAVPGAAAGARGGFSQDRTAGNIQTVVPAGTREKRLRGPGARQRAVFPAAAARTNTAVFQADGKYTVNPEKQALVAYESFRVFRRLVCVSHAALDDSSSC